MGLKGRRSAELFVRPAVRPGRKTKSERSADLFCRSAVLPVTITKSRGPQEHARATGPSSSPLPPQDMTVAARVPIRSGRRHFVPRDRGAGWRGKPAATTARRQAGDGFCLFDRELSAGLRKRPRAYERPLGIKSIRDARAFDRRHFKAMRFGRQAFQFRNSFPLVVGVFRPAKDLYRSPRPGVSNPRPSRNWGCPARACRALFCARAGVDRRYRGARPYGT